MNAHCTAASHRTDAVRGMQFPDCTIGLNVNKGLNYRMNTLRERIASTHAVTSIEQE